MWCPRLQCYQGNQQVCRPFGWSLVAGPAGAVPVQWLGHQTAAQLRPLPCRSAPWLRKQAGTWFSHLSHFWSAGVSICHSLMSLGYSPDARMAVKAITCMISSVTGSGVLTDFFCAISILFMCCGTPSASVQNVCTTDGMSTASMTCSPVQWSSRCLRSCCAVKFV